MKSPPSTHIPEDLEQALQQLARANTALIATDFDGTLAEIVEDPAAARPVPGATEALERIAQLPHTHTVIISGRSMQDLARLASPPASVHLIASHGAEFSPNTPGGTPEPDIVPALKERIEHELRDLLKLDPGLQLEIKATGFALHYRRARSRARAEGAVDRVLQGPATHEGVRTKPGKEVIELTLTDATKGKALSSIRNALDADITVFVGDDKTDEEGFAELAGSDITIKVGEGETTAKHRIASPTAVVALLDRIAETRK